MAEAIVPTIGLDEDSYVKTLSSRDGGVRSPIAVKGCRGAAR
jgi:hypothetical protein